MPRLPFVSFLTLALLAGSVCPLGARDYRVIVPATSQDRAGQVVSFELPSDAPVPAAVVDPAGHSHPVQPDEDGRRASFVIPFQRAGEALTLKLTKSTSSSPTQVQTRHDGPRLDLAASDKPILSYWVGVRPPPRPEIDPVYRRSGFIHPVFTPSGAEVTDSYPANHVHHHGIWSPWTKVVFQGRPTDFWNVKSKLGTVEGEGLTREWSGPVHAGFVARHRFIDLSSGAPIVALNENWEVTVYAPTGDGPHVFDLTITQSCATNDPLILPEYHYGGLGYRGPAEWDGADRARFLTSEGLTDRVAAHATRARWCHIGGEVNGRLAGTAILGHPANFRAPQPMRIHPKEPFFCFAPSQLGDWQISPGETYTARYRFVVADGEPNAAQIEAYWQGFAETAQARLEPL